MTDLFERLFPRLAGIEDLENISIHSFRAALGDYATGNTTRAQIVNYWSLDTDAQTDLDVLLAEIDAGNSAARVRFLVELHDVMLITEEGAKYQTKAEFRTRMGL